MTRIKSLNSPMAKMINTGGIVYVPAEAYLRRLQRLHATDKINAHANTLYPGIAHIAGASDTGVASLFRSILAVSEGGRNLHGLELLFLSCLQGIEASGDDKLALAGVASWSNFKPDKLEWPIVLVDRASNQFKYLPKRPAAATLRRCSAQVLANRTVWDVFKFIEQERAGVQAPGGYDPQRAADEDGPVKTCKDNVTAWASAVNGYFGALSALLIAAGKTSNMLGLTGIAANFLGVTGSTITGLGQMIGTFGCQFFAPEPEDNSPAGSKLTDENTESPAGDLAPGTQPSGPPSEESEWTPYPGSSGGSGSSGSSGGSGSSDGSKGDPENEWNAWPYGSDPSTPPPPPPSSATPDPDGSGGSYSKPPGFRGPWPPEDLPNPDDVGGGPTSFPNGAVFVPSRTLRALAILARTSVSSTQVGLSQSGVATFQLSVSANALGAGAA